MIDVEALHYMYRWYLRAKSQLQSPMSMCRLSLRQSSTNKFSKIRHCDVKQREEVCSAKKFKNFKIDGITSLLTIV
jgi:hypothetical protein